MIIQTSIITFVIGFLLGRFIARKKKKPETVEVLIDYQEEEEEQETKEIAQKEVKQLPEFFVCIQTITTDGGALGRYQFQVGEMLVRLQGENNYSSGLIIVNYNVLISMPEYFIPKYN